MHISKKVVGVAAVVVLAGAGMTAVAWAQPAQPSAQSSRSDHDDNAAEHGKGHDHGLHLGQTMDHHSAKAGKADIHGLHLGKSLAHRGITPGHDHGLHLGQREHLRGEAPPGLDKAKHRVGDHRHGADDEPDPDE